MLQRKELKARAKKVLRHHYILLVAVCLMAAFLGVEFTSSFDILKMETPTAEESSISGGVASAGELPGQSALDEALDTIQEKQAELEKERADESAGNEENTEKKSEIFGRSRGVFSMLVNAVSSGAIFLTVYKTVQSISGSENIAIAILVAAGFLLVGTVWFFIQNTYRVISGRIFLESRTYEKVSVQRFMFLMRVKKWCKASWTMFVLFVFQSLWILTVVGAVIKRYSYYLVPYIVAENPDIKALDAITLSRRMMKGHKWECFVFELSFFGWYLLEMATFGLVGVFFSNPYRSAAFGEYYAELRKLAKENKIEGSELLNDRYLYEKAETGVLQEAYADVMERLQQPEPELKGIGGVRGFLAKWFGILFLYSGVETEYEQARMESIRVEKYRDAVEGKSYPGRLFPISEKDKRKNVETLCYARNYSIPSLILLFFTFSVIGWLWEVSLHLITDGEFVNRGVLHGPWLPIYGTGAVMILLLLKRFRERPVVEFFAAIVLCGCVEYFTSWYLEMTHGGQRWWDYSGYFLNLNGRICAEGLLVFGLGGMAIVYVAAPLLDNMYRKISLKILVPACAVLLIFYIADQQYSSRHPNAGKGITDYARSQEESFVAHRNKNEKERKQWQQIQL
ncbi:MAG: DUF975 family protein [Eubacteriales bacterium]|nr:DUF975 family protein [Eubacteriales bacterium]